MQKISCSLQRLTVMEPKRDLSQKKKKKKSKCLLNSLALEQNGTIILLLFYSAGKYLTIQLML